MVNNAGIMSFCDVEVTPIKEWQRLYDVNVLGQVRMIQAFLPLLRRSKGRVVNIASANGKLENVKTEPNTRVGQNVYPFPRYLLW